MTIHLFNPEHDLVLATENATFTPPKAARELYADLGFLPALWAEEGDIVLVDDVEAAKEKLRHIKLRKSVAQLMDRNQLATLLKTKPQNLLKIKPWGWDRNVVAQLKQLGVEERWLPSQSWLQTIKQISSREWTATNLLPQLKKQLSTSHITGEAFVVRSIDRLHALLTRHPLMVVKAPWSSSGRGIRYIDTRPDPSTAGWCSNTIQQQGCITAEPYYNKVKDFGMEFVANEDGTVTYLGLSLFSTTGKMYSGSLLATESHKRELLSNYIDITILDAIAAEIQKLMLGKYIGPFGVDMMIVKAENNNPASHNLFDSNLSDNGLSDNNPFDSNLSDNDLADNNPFNKNLSDNDLLSNLDKSQLLIHPCVELNLRRTMGHVALSLSPTHSQPRQVMNITHSAGYHLRFHTLKSGLINNYY